MRLIDADELIEKASREKLDTRELIIKMIENAPTVVDKENEDLKRECSSLNEVASYLDVQVRKERDLSREIVQMVLNFQRKEQQHG